MFETDPDNIRFDNYYSLKAADDNLLGGISGKIKSQDTRLYENGNS